jgi:hypothetical protein
VSEPAPRGEKSEPTDDKQDDKPQPTLLEQMGGISGLIYSSVPVLVFVLANAMFGLQVGIWSAVGSAVAITVLRVVRKEPMQPAISGFFGVAIAAFIARAPRRAFSCTASGRASFIAACSCSLS